MTCRDFVDFLNDYLDGELLEHERAVFDAHLAICPPCVTYLQTYRQTVQLTQASSDSAGGAAHDAPEELIQAILAARHAQRNKA